MSLNAPFLKSVSASVSQKNAKYPLNCGFIASGSLLVNFENPVTILTGDNGSGKSTFLEALAHLIGFDVTGGANGYMPFDHSSSIETSGAALGEIMKASWLPKVSDGWFFRAETFHSVSSYLDRAAISVGSRPPNYLALSHGEGFLDFFKTRLNRRGIYLIDEPESAISPSRHEDFNEIIKNATSRGNAQFIIATHSPIIMNSGGGDVLNFTKLGIEKIHLRDTCAFKVYADFIFARAWTHE